MNEKLKELSRKVANVCSNEEKIKIGLIRTWKKQNKKQRKREHKEQKKRNKQIETKMKLKEMEKREETKTIRKNENEMNKRVSVVLWQSSRPVTGGHLGSIPC